MSLSGSAPNASLALPWNALAALGGFASRGELIALGCSPDFIDLGVWYRRILPMRKGWYASVGTPLAVQRALRAGGRLACVSALAHYEGRELPAEAPVHILVSYGASRLGAGTVVHWTRRELAGTRTVVAEEVARAQAAGCRATR